MTDYNDHKRHGCSERPCLFCGEPVFATVYSATGEVVRCDAHARLGYLFDEDGRLVSRWTYVAHRCKVPVGRAKEGCQT